MTEVDPRSIEELEIERARLADINPIPDCEISPEGLRWVVGFLAEASQSSGYLLSQYLGTGPEGQDLPEAAEKHFHMLNERAIIGHILLDQLLIPKGGERRWDDIFESIKRAEHADSWQQSALDVAEEIGGQELRDRVELEATTSFPRRSATNILIGIEPEVEDYLTYRRMVTPLGNRSAEKWYAECHKPRLTLVEQPSE